MKFVLPAALVLAIVVCAFLVLKYSHDDSKGSAAQQSRMTIFCDSIAAAKGIM